MVFGIFLFIDLPDAGGLVEASATDEVGADAFGPASDGDMNY